MLHSQSDDLVKPARDQSGFGIVPELKAVTNSCGDCDHIFERSAEFDSDQVLLDIDPELRIAKIFLNVLVDEVFIKANTNKPLELNSGSEIRIGDNLFRVEI